MSVKVTVKLNTSKINTLIEAHKKALEMTADAVLSDINTSILEDSAFVDRSELINCIMRIVFDTPYARRLYWHPEYNFRKDKNPNAQGKWMDSYLYGDNKQFIIDTYSKFLKMLSEGLIK